MNLVPLSAPPRLDLAEHLEALAHRVRGGAVTDLVLFYDGKDTGQYH